MNMVDKGNHEKIIQVKKECQQQVLQYQELTKKSERLKGSQGNIKIETGVILFGGYGRGMQYPAVNILKD